MPEPWTRLARRQHGVVRHDQLAATGRSRTVIGRMVGDGTLLPVCRGVFLAGGAPFTWHARVWAATLATDGLAAFFTAGRLWGIHDSIDLPIRVLVLHSRRVSIPSGVRVTRAVRWRGTVAEVNGLPATSRSWTVLDLLGVLPASQASRLADRALQQGWLCVGEVDDRLRTHPRRPGNSQLRRIAAQLGDGAASESERRLHVMLRRAGVRGWVPNHPVVVAGEVVAVIDVAVPARMMAIEVDGMAYHVDVDRFRRDRRRQNDLVALGWTVLRFTWADLTERPGYVIALLRRAAA